MASLSPVRLILVRHPPVARVWSGRCYGQSDPGLSRAGRAMIAPLVDQLAALKPQAVIHSDLTRTKAIALPLAEKLGIPAIADPLWRERDFGTWEGRAWTAIYRETGDAMDGMIDNPDHFQPGGGETTAALARRVGQALANLPAARPVAIITHGGPIASARALQASIERRHLASLIPATGSITLL